MKRIIALCVAVIAIALVSGHCSAQAQEESKKETSSPAGKFEPVQPYRLDFSFNELADGKVLNTRHYSLNLTAGDSNEIKIGTRVPVVSASSPNSTVSQWQYLDVGTNIWSQLREHGDQCVLVVRADVSNLDTSNDSEHVGSMPIVRQIKISGSTLLVVGKPILIGSTDDPNSKRQFQLEVTVTKLR